LKVVEQVEIMSHRFEDLTRIFSMGDEAVAAVLDRAFEDFDFLTRTQTWDNPAPGYAFMMKTFRGLVVLRDNGCLNSAELVLVKDPVQFRTSPEYRGRVLSTARWNNIGNFINDVTQKSNNRNETGFLDRDGAVFQATLRDQVKLMRILLSRRLEGTDAQSVIFAGHPLSSLHQTPAGKFSDQFGQRVMARLNQTVVPEYIEALTQLRGRLEQQVNAAMVRSGVNSVDGYNWAAAASSADHPTLKNDRLQAVSAYPILWPLFQQPFSACDIAISNRQSLAEAILSDLGIRKSDVAALQNLTYDDLGLSAAPSRQNLNSIVMPFIRSLPPGKPPRGREQWTTARALVTAAETIDAILRTNDGTLALEGFGGNWDTIVPEKAEQMANGLRDMVNFYHRYVWDPACSAYRKQTGHSSRWSQSDTAALLLKGRFLGDLADTATQWHDSHQDIADYMESTFVPANRGDGGEEWSVLHKGPNRFTATNGCTVTFLTNERDLKEEGRAMKHCVGDYAISCQLGNKHIFSVRDPEGNRIATGEINLVRLRPLIGKGDLEDAPLNTLPRGLEQLRGPSNRTPSHLAYEAMWDYVRGIASGGLYVDYDKLVDQTEERRKTADIREAPYDWTNENAIREIWRRCSFMMSKKTARSGPYDILEKHYQELVDRNRATTPRQPSGELRAFE